MDDLSEKLYLIMAFLQHLTLSFCFIRVLETEKDLQHKFEAMIEQCAKQNLSLEEHICRMCCQKETASANSPNPNSLGGSDEVPIVAESATLSDSEDDFHDATTHHEKDSKEDTPQLCYTCSEKWYKNKIRYYAM